MKLIIGTRNSKLAMWQAEYVSDRLKEAGAEVELIPIKTKGDKILDVSISKIGSKGVFTEELDEMLKNGTIDIAVHSAKDIQSSLDQGFELLAFTEREKSHDVILSDKPFSLSEGMTLGTSSTRRIALINHFYPNCKTVPVRGNLQTRIKKMQDGHCDALMLAYAGVARMGYADMIRHEFDLQELIPPVGQGCIAIEGYHSLDDKKKTFIKTTLNHRDTEVCIRAERAFLKTLDGGCSIPVYGNAVLEKEAIVLTGGICSLDGVKLLTKTLRGTIQNPEELGKTLGDQILREGGKEILNQIKQTLNQ